MALYFIFAITPNREIGLVRKCGQYIQITSWSRLFHFSEKTPFEYSPHCFVGDGKEFF